jgi:hypothetical protein
MDFNAAIELIIKDLNDACKIIDDFKSYQGVPELHIEFAKAKCKSSADIIALLKKCETTVIKPLPEDKKFSEKEILTIEETVVEEKIIPVKTIKTAEKQSPEKSVKEIETKQPTEKIIKTQQKSSSIIADNFADMPARINERLGNRESKDDVTEIIKSKPISSLGNEIGLNDSFFLIREIFDGDKGKYEQAISKLEEAAAISDAKAIISEYSNPDDDNEAMALLLDLIKRKLNPNE